MKRSEQKRSVILQKSQPKKLMESNPKYYKSLADLQATITSKERGGVLLDYRNCDNYPGMVLSLMIVFNNIEKTLGLDLQWQCLGLDLYGDTLQESYVYGFENLDALLNYLKTTYHMEVTDIPLKHEFEQSHYPNPIKDPEKKPEFETAWKQFQLDFENGKFLDSSQKLVYTSVGQ